MLSKDFLKTKRFLPKKKVGLKILNYWLYKTLSPFRAAANTFHWSQFEPTGVHSKAHSAAIVSSMVQARRLELAGDVTLAPPTGRIQHVLFGRLADSSPLGPEGTRLFLDIHATSRDMDIWRGFCAAATRLRAL